MPLYKIAGTGEIVSRPKQYVNAFPVGTFTLVDGETRDEEKERLLREAEEDKVNIEELLTSPDVYSGDSIDLEGGEYAS